MPSIAQQLNTELHWFVANVNIVMCALSKENNIVAFNYIKHYSYYVCIIFHGFSIVAILPSLGAITVTKGSVSLPTGSQSVTESTRKKYVTSVTAYTV